MYLLSRASEWYSPDIVLSLETRPWLRSVARWWMLKWLMMRQCFKEGEKMAEGEREG